MNKITKILVVDDKDENLYLLESLLKGSGYDVALACNGKEGLDILHIENFDLIISDILMPVMDGYQFLRKVKANNEFKNIPFIFYTATYTSEKDKELALALGADQFILKPTEPDEFLRILREMAVNEERMAIEHTAPPLLEDKEVFKLYSERLVNKLEKKMMDLEKEVAAHKKSEEKLKASESKYRTLIENLPQKIFLKDANSVFVTCNKNYAKDLAISEEEIKGKNDYDFYPKEQAEKYIAEDQLVIQSKQAKEFEEEYLINGEARWLDMIKTPVYDENNSVSGILGIFWDVTERKNLEMQLYQSQKMEGIGRLASGIAHDFNNILTAIIGSAELATLSLEKSEPYYEDFSDILKSAFRASDLTRQLLAFSRKQKLQLKVITINMLVKGLHKMLLRIIEEAFDLNIFLTEDLWKIKVDPGQIEQVIVNLVVNARDAMIDGGHLTIETQNIVIDENYANMQSDIVPGEYVMLSISDSGCGMTEDVKNQIFDPFFTTKIEGKGTGLGLSTVYGIVKQSNGHINVYSEVGEGTTFKIYFPRVIEDEDEIVVKENNDVAPEGNETILIVEDDETVRKLSCKILEQQGYEVLSADTAEKALSMCENTECPVDLLITDVIMPNMNGVEMTELISKRWPDSKVLFMSGYTENTIFQNKVLSPGIPYLQKPFRLIELQLKVREVLDENPEN